MTDTIFETHIEKAEATLADAIAKLDKTKGKFATDVDAEHRVMWSRGTLQTATKRFQWFEKLPENKKVAAEIHERTCRFNHTDGCEWGYRVEDADNWDGNTYLAQAEAILADVPFTVAMKVLTKL